MFGVREFDESQRRPVPAETVQEAITARVVITRFAVPPVGGAT